MERRRQQRYTVDSPVRVTVLGEHPVTRSGRIANFSGRGLRVLLDGPLEQGAAVRIDLDDGLLLGEVCYCAKLDEVYAAGLELDQSLSGLNSLRNLFAALRGEQNSEEAFTPSPPAVCD